MTRDIIVNLENGICNTTTSGRVIELIITQDDFNSISSIEGLKEKEILNVCTSVILSEAMPPVRL